MRPEKAEKEKEPSFQQDNTGQLEPQRVLHQRWRVLIKPNIDDKGHFGTILLNPQLPNRDEYGILCPYCNP